MAVPAFDPKELEMVGRMPGMFGPAIPVYSNPVSNKEAVKALYERRPYWQMHGMETGLSMFSPLVNPDNIARGFIFEGRQLDPSQYGGKDMCENFMAYCAELASDIIENNK